MTSWNSIGVGFLVGFVTRKRGLGYLVVQSSTRATPMLIGFRQDQQTNSFNHGCDRPEESFSCTVLGGVLTMGFGELGRT